MSSMPEETLIIMGAQRLYGGAIRVERAGEVREDGTDLWVIQEPGSGRLLAHAWVDPEDGLPVYKPHGLLC